MNDIENEYRTHDTPLAAYLLLEGFQLERIEYMGEKATFVFAGAQADGFYRAILQYHAGLAQGNIVSYYSVYRHLVRRIKEQLQWVKDEL